jgi:hypothetical protein
LDENDVKNASEHQKLFDQNKILTDTMKSIDGKIEPIADTYKTVGTVAKWFMALMVFLSVLGGTIIAWTKIFNK